MRFHSRSFGSVGGPEGVVAQAVRRRRTKTVRMLGRWDVGKITEIILTSQHPNVPTMSDDLSIQGTLAETTVPDLFRSLVRSSETGVVSLDAIGRTDAIYFNEGKVIFASSSDPDMGLGEILLRSGELDLQQYNHAMERLVVSRRMGALLCE